MERGGGHESAATGRDEVAVDDSFLRVGALGGTGHAPFLGAVAAKWKVDFLMPVLNCRTTTRDRKPKSEKQKTGATGAAGAQPGPASPPGTAG